MPHPAIKTGLEDITSKLTNPPSRIFLKNEFEQPSGSFKIRGLGHLIETSILEAKRLNKPGVEVFSSSGGNAGLAAAYSGNFFGVKCTVVLPTTSKAVVIAQLQELGATVLVHGAHWGEADEYLRKVIIAELDDSVYPVYCHPFDNPVIWDGHSGLVDEIVEDLTSEDLSRVKGVVCSVGGGGLYNGIVNGLRRNGLQVPVLAVETVQTPCFSEAVKAGKVVTLSKIVTLATTLGSPYLAQKAFENYSTYPTKVEVIDDLDAVAGVVDFYDLTKVLVEPACGAALALALRKSDLLENSFGKLAKSDIVIVVACGGSSTNLEGVEEFRKLVNPV